MYLVSKLIKFRLRWRDNMQHSLAIVKPSLIIEWHPTKNGDITNCLATSHPEIASQWHSTKNGNLTACDVSLRNNIVNQLDFLAFR